MSIIFFDIDGTVMDLDGTIPSSAVTAVRRLRGGTFCTLRCGSVECFELPVCRIWDVLAALLHGFAAEWSRYKQKSGQRIEFSSTPEVDRFYASP